MKFKNKKIGFLGLGIENYSLINFLLQEKIKCDITICDHQELDYLKEQYKYFATRQNICWKLGKEELKHLTGFDVLYRSPGWPLFDPAIAEAVKYGVKLSSAINLFFRLCPTHNTIGVTGTKGKGTTASLIYKILQTAGRRVWLGGNIGIAPFDFLKKIKTGDWVVLELSSFQLEDMRYSPHIAVITNFSSEHLAPADPNNPNFHKSLKSYWRAKTNILKFQKNHDRAIVNIKLRKRNLKYGNAKKIFFTKSDLPTSLAGEHNKENIAAAAEACFYAGVGARATKKAVAGFGGLEHRLEFVREADGVEYYNDSFATTPEAAMTALKSFKAPIILLAGGAEKNSNFKPLAGLIKRKVKFIVLLEGDATPRLNSEINRAGYPRKQKHLASNIKEAVRAAKRESAKGDVVLLSPACASFGMFKNYKERGNLFKEEIKKLK